MIFERGKYVANLAQDEGEVQQAQAFRAMCFGLLDPVDSDAYDTQGAHLLVRHKSSDQLVAYYRFLTFQASEIASSYSAQFYDLSALQSFEGPMIEIGRFCLRPDQRDPDILRLAWGTMAALVDQTKATLLFGCTSFEGTSWAPYADTFGYLDQRHKAPCRWQPLPKAQETIPLGPHPNLDVTQALRRMPPLLRSYLTMGGWVSDHAVVDAQMKSLHVFTAVEIAKIPPMRKKLLRALC